MSTLARLGAFVAGLAVVFTGSFALGAATDDAEGRSQTPTTDQPAPVHTGHPGATTP